MTKTTRARSKSSSVIPPQGKRNLAAMRKAIREMRRDADAKGIELAVADKELWSVPK